MNILYLCDEYPPGRHGGIGTLVQQLAREMVQQGHNVIVAGFYDWGYGEADQQDDHGVQVFRFRRRLSSKMFYKQDTLLVRALYRLCRVTGIFQWDIRRSLSSYQKFLEQLIKRYKIEVVEMPDYHDYMRFCKTYTPFPELSVPVVMKLNGSMTYFAKEAGHDVQPFIWRMEHEMMHSTSAVSSASAYTANRTAEYLEYHKNITVLYNGIDTRNQFGQVQKVDGRVVFTGTLIEKKGIFQLMKAWNLVHEQMPFATLWVFGKGNTDRLQRILTNEASKTVTFKGHTSREELLPRLAEARMAVFPSYAECFALAPMEAMACNTAVIYSKRTSGPELIKNEEDGILIDPDNEQEIADKIVYLLQHSDVCDTLAANGKIKVAHFDIRQIAARNVEFYEQVLNR